MKRQNEKSIVTKASDLFHTENALIGFALTYHDVLGEGVIIVGSTKAAAKRAFLRLALKRPVLNAHTYRKVVIVARHGLKGGSK